MSQNRAALREFKEMTKEQRLEYFARAKRVTVGTITQLIDTTPGRAIFKKYYVAKIRGHIVGNANDYKHETSGLARAFGRVILAQWQKEFKGKSHDYEI